MTGTSNNNRRRRPNNNNGRRPQQQRPSQSTDPVSTADLVTIARDAGVEDAETLDRDALMAALADRPDTVPVARGILDVLPDGYGFVRTRGYLPSPDDVYIAR